MLIIAALLLLGVPTPAEHQPAPRPAPRVLQCTAKNTSAGKDRKCSVKLAKGALLQPCDAAARTAGHCALQPRFVAWVTSTHGARCELTRKTDWKKRVGIRVSDATRNGAGSCTLFVSLR